MRLALLVMLPLLLHAQTRIDLGSQTKGQLPMGTRENIRYAHLFADSGSGGSLDPWTYAAGNPWAEAVAAGGSIIYLVPGFYLVSSCPSIVPAAVSIVGFNRQSTTLLPECRELKDRVVISAATNASPIAIETDVAHGFSSGDTINITGVPGNSAANGDWQITAIDSTHFSLDGSTGSGDYVDTKTGMWAGQIFPVSAFGTAFPTQVDLPAVHGLVDGDRVFIRDAVATSTILVNGFHYVTAVDADSVSLEGSARPIGAITGGVLERLVPTSMVATEINGRGIEIRGLKFDAGSRPSWLSKYISFKANESVIEEVEGRFNAASLAQTASTFIGSQSASIRFDADASAGNTIDLTLSGGGSRATGPYPTYTTSFAAPIAVTSMTSGVGAAIGVTLATAADFQDGDQITISTTPETTAAGAAGTFRAVRLNLNFFGLVGAVGTGSPCSSGCGGATAVQSSLERSNLAKEFADHLNGPGEFKRDYFASNEGSIVYLMERHLEAGPITFTLTSPVAHTLDPWAAHGRGGTFFLMVESESFSSRFSRIFCSGGSPVGNCIGIQGINNQHSFRDLRLSGSLNAGWGFRFASGSGIQNIDIFNMTTEAAYGAIEIGSLVGGSIRTVYMEAFNEFGIRVLDPVGAAEKGGFSFTHGISIHGGILEGSPGLELKKGKGITAENVVIPGGCVIGERCEDCQIVASWTSTCDVQSPGGHLENVTLIGKSNPGVSRYGERMSTAAGAILATPVTNFAKQSDDLTAGPWFAAADTSLVSGTNPLGVTQQISRTSVASPAQFQEVTAGVNPVAGLLPDTRYTMSYWTRVLTSGASCRLNGSGAAINFEVTVKPEDGWIRVAGPITTDSGGTHAVVVRCKVVEAGLPDITFDVWGFMVHQAVTDRALMPYIPTNSTAVTVGPGLYVAPGAGASIAPGGSTPSCETFTVPESALTAASAIEDVVLFNLPARAKISAVNVKHSQAFTGGGLTAMTVSVGDSSGAAFYTSAFDIFQPSGNVAMQDTNLFKSSTSAARNVLARFTATGANVVDANSGSLDVAVCWAVMP